MPLRPSWLLGPVLLGLALGRPALAQYPAVDPVRGVMTMAPLLDRATPAVVNIAVVSHEAAAANPLMRDPFFRRFFDEPDRPRTRQTLAAGSGVIIDARQGLVVTNDHVAQNADQITVTLKDRRELKAELVGHDPATDIALLRIPAGNLAQLPFGDSDRVEVGDLVLAIGNPFGLGQTVTSGIISALGRSGITSDRYEDFIQTDAPINPGNSGGALIDTRGQLIGINTAILAPGGGNVGIGFAVPSDIVRGVVDQILRHGEVRRGRIGVSLQDLAPGRAELGRGVAEGALIARVEQGSSAEAAGLKPGDIVVQAGGSRVRNAAELSSRIGLTEPDQALELTFLRDGQQRTARVPVSGKPAAAQAAAGAASLAGAEVSELPQDHPAYGSVDGVLVTGVEGGSAAEALGLRPGDIILGVNRQPVSTVEQLEQRLRRPGRRLALDVLRDDAELLLSVR